MVNRMSKTNNKGYTLVELIATIVILALVMGIGAYSITAIINSSKEKNYELLIKEIKNAVELVYQDCVISKLDDVKELCPLVGDTNGDNKITLTDTSKCAQQIAGIVKDKNMCDTNLDGIINAKDNKLTSEYMAGATMANFGNYILTLEKLVEYGYLKGNSAGENDKLTIVNPKDNVDISNCTIAYNYKDGNVQIVTSKDAVGSCPTNEDFTNY